MARSAISGRVAIADRVAQSRKFASVALNGTTQYVWTSRQMVYNLTNFSVEAWVKGASGQTTKAVFAESRTADGAPAIRMATGSAGNTGKFSAFIRANGSVILLNNVLSTTTVFDNTWHHIVWSDAGGDVTFYVDGNADATNFDYTRGTLTLDRASWGNSLFGGAPGNFFAGSIALPRLYNKALSSGEVTAAYNNTVSMAKANLLSELRMAGSPTTNTGSNGLINQGWVVTGSPTFSTTNVPTTNPQYTESRVAI